MSGMGMRFRLLIIVGVNVMMTAGCARLSTTPAQYSGLTTAEVVDDDATQVNVRRPAPKRPARVQNSSAVEPVAVLESSIVARRNWKPQNVAALENIRPLNLNDMNKGEVVTGSIKKGSAGSR